MSSKTQTKLDNLLRGIIIEGCAVRGRRSHGGTACAPHPAETAPEGRELAELAAEYRDE